jgi:hypothetical protein
MNGDFLIDANAKDLFTPNNKLDKEALFVQYDFSNPNCRPDQNYLIRDLQHNITASYISPFFLLPVPVPLLGAGDNSLRLNGSTQRIDLNSVPAIANDKDLTIFLIARRHDFSTSDLKILLHNRNDPPYTRFRFIIDNSFFGQFHFNLFDGTNAYPATITNTFITPIFTSVALVISNNLKTIDQYVNGNLIGQHTIINPIAMALATWNIGSVQNSSRAPVDVAFFSLYQKYFAPAEIHNLHHKLINKYG